METVAPALPTLRETFTLLADKTRLRLLLELGAGERNVSDLTAEVALSQPTVSHHLMLLRQMGTVVSRRDGKRVFSGLGDRVTARSGGGLLLRCDGGTNVSIGQPRAEPGAGTPVPLNSDSLGISCGHAGFDELDGGGGRPVC